MRYATNKVGSAVRHKLGILNTYSFVQIEQGGNPAPKERLEFFFLSTIVHGSCNRINDSTCHHYKYNGLLETGGGNMSAP